MKKELVWNVWRINPNTNEIEPYNVFKHYTFSKWLYKLKKTYLKGDDFQADKFLEEIKGWLQYCFWSKFEYEVLITDLLKRKENKIDIYAQIMLNWDIFKDYLINNYKHIKKVD